MYTRERAERITREYVRKSLEISFISLPVTARVGTYTRLKPIHSWISIGLDRAPFRIFDVGTLKNIQIEMLKVLFRRYGVKYSESEGKAMISALTGGNLGRYAKSIVKAIPIIGQIMWDESMPVMAAASTYALAQITVLRLELESAFFTLNLEAVKKVYAQEFEKGKDFASRLEKESPGSTLFIDFEAAKHLYDKACKKEKEVTPEDDPFAISIEDEKDKETREEVRSSADDEEPPSESVVEKIEKLAALKKRGVITEEEFNTQKQKLLARI